jgi:hypothetical protein
MPGETYKYGQPQWHGSPIPAYMCPTRCTHTRTRYLYLLGDLPAFLGCCYSTQTVAPRCVLSHKKDEY